MTNSDDASGHSLHSNTPTHIRQICAEINKLDLHPEDELYVAAKEPQTPYEPVKEVAATAKLSVELFTTASIATPAYAAIMIQLGADGVFVRAGIFKSGNPAHYTAAAVKLALGSLQREHRGRVDRPALPFA